MNNNMIGSQQKNVLHSYFYIIIILPIIFWACAFPFIKIGLQYLSPINLTIMRLFFVCIIFLFMMIIKPRCFSKIDIVDIPRFFLLGFFGVVVYHLGLNYGETLISASAASLIIATIPIFVVMFAALFLKENISFKLLSGILFSLSGVIIISLFGTADASLEINYVLAAGAVLVAAVVGAGYTIGGKKLLARYSALSLTAYVFLFGCLGLIPLVSTSLIDEISIMPLAGWGVVLFLALFPTVIGYVLWYIALDMKTASEISVFLYFTPVVSTMISALFFNEQITMLFLVGGFLVLFGLYIVNTSTRKKT
ncbi:MAG: EamA family transporter [Candidatus Thermoplasmatota archaeon]